MRGSLIIYIAVMAIVTYLIRMMPIMVFRRKITSQFIQSFLYYVPYAVLGAMTIPAVFYATDNVISAVVGTIVAFVLAYFNRSLIVVAVSASLSAYLAEWVMVLLK